MKPKYLNLRPAEVARFLRPSGLVVIPVTPQPFATKPTFIGFLEQWHWKDRKGNVGDPLEWILTQHDCPLGGPGDQWVGREALIAKESAYGLKVAYEADGHFSRGRRIEIDGDDGSKHVEACEWPFANKRLPAFAMPDDFARIRKTTTRVELRRVRTITEAEAIDVGTLRGTNEDGSAGYGDLATIHRFPAYTVRFGFKHDFNARYPGAWDRDDYAFFCWFTDTL